MVDVFIPITACLDVELIGIQFVKQFGGVCGDGFETDGTTVFVGVFQNCRQGVAQAIHVICVAKREEIDAMRIRAFAITEREEPSVLFADHVLIFGLHAVHGDERVLAGILSITIEIVLYLLFLI